MKRNRILLIFLLSAFIFGCTKLHEKLNDQFVIAPGGGNSNAAGLLLNAYNDLNTPFTNQDQMFSLQENTSDECLVPTRGGDWDDNGVWRVLHAHAWDATHGQSSSVFINLGTIESDATTVLALSPTAEQAAEAIFLRSLAQFYFLDLYGQVPYRTVANYNTVDASPVMKPADAIDTLVTNLTGIISILDPTNTPYRAGPDAARFLLMKVLLNKQAFLNKNSPAAALPADMQQVIALGQAIVSGGNYQLTSNYFDNFGPNNGGFAAGYGTGTSKERIFSTSNNGTSSNNGQSPAGVDARWMMTLHYNSWDAPGVYGGAGWNGFSTIADFYNAFDANDSRRGNVAYPGVTSVSGLKVGLLEGQQYNEANNPIKDRKGNPLVFTPNVNLVEANKDSLEGAGIRIIKYAPDYANYSGGVQRNQLIFFRYADVILMIAEAQLRNNDAAGALATVNILRAARGASPLGSVSLVNTSNLYDGTTLVAERQKEMYWESWRRQDLIRFGVFLQPWALKTADNPKYLLFPIPATQLVANPNLKQNPGY
ncbi:MAG: RagB/SusD family nutrient uptake outer membrane protein [Bacteroidota bacterium]|nr:RagB/SusD family nutrient uptake outer membrane protein [Bacteroidota bacterium]